MSGMTTFSYDRNLLHQSFVLTQELLSELIGDCISIGPFRPEHEIVWHKKLSRLSTEVAQFVDITTLLTRALSNRRRHSVEDIKKSHIHLLFVMKGIGKAQAKADFIALEDLIKHELKDNLTQWKIDLLPQLKKLID